MRMAGMKKLRMEGQEGADKTPTNNSSNNNNMKNCNELLCS